MGETVSQSLLIRGHPIVSSTALVNLGLVAARHLKHFGYSPTVVLPKKGRATIYTNLLQQLADLQVPVLETIESSDYCKFVLIIDALFGFSFKGPAREPFAGIISSLVSTNVPVLSVDAPSGWDIEEGDIHKTGFVPEAVISLTVPKLAMKGYQGTHYVGGR